MDHPPVLELLTVLIVVLIGALQLREGAFRAWLLLVNVFAAGLLTFNLWEPLARGLGTASPGLDPYADALTIAVLFSLSLTGLRLLTVKLAPVEVALPPLVRRGGGLVFGLATGYLVAGILLCLVQTLPLPQRFLWYDPREGMGLGAPDRVWLAAMHRASGVIFDLPAGRERWFDADGSFIVRYARYRRRDENGFTARNRGEFPTVLEVKPPESRTTDLEQSTVRMLP